MAALAETDEDRKQLGLVAVRVVMDIAPQALRREFVGRWNAKYPKKPWTEDMDSGYRFMFGSGALLDATACATKGSATVATSEDLRHDITPGQGVVIGVKQHVVKKVKEGELELYSPYTSDDSASKLPIYKVFCDEPLEGEVSVTHSVANFDASKCEGLVEKARHRTGKLKGWVSIRAADGDEASPHFALFAKMGKGKVNAKAVSLARGFSGATANCGRASLQSIWNNHMTNENALHVILKGKTSDWDNSVCHYALTVQSHALLPKTGKSNKYHVAATAIKDIRNSKALHLGAVRLSASQLESIVSTVRANIKILDEQYEEEEAFEGHAAAMIEKVKKEIYTMGAENLSREFTAFKERFDQREQSQASLDSRISRQTWTEGGTCACFTQRSGIMLPRTNVGTHLLLGREDVFIRIEGLKEGRYVQIAQFRANKGAHKKQKYNQYWYLVNASKHNLKQTLDRSEVGHKDKRHLKSEDCFQIWLDPSIKLAVVAMAPDPPASAAKAAAQHGHDESQISSALFDSLTAGASSTVISDVPVLRFKVCEDTAKEHTATLKDRCNLFFANSKTLDDIKKKMQKKSVEERIFKP